MKRLYEAHNLAPARPLRGLASYYLEKEVQVVVVGLDLDIGMKLSMRRIPYEGAPTVCEAAAFPHYDSCTATAATATQLSIPL